MNNRTVIAADIAKNVFQCVQFKNNRQLGKNKAYKRNDFIKLITNSPPSFFVMETCSCAQHWARLAKKHHHEVVCHQNNTVRVRKKCRLVSVKKQEINNYDQH